MPRLRYSPAAINDLRSIAAYIARDKAQAARRWVAKIRAKCRLIAQHPGVGDLLQEYGDVYRTTYVGSYVIIFREADERVEIVRVFRGDQQFPLLGS